MASVDPTIAPIVATASSAKIAWDLLHIAYANRSHTRIFSLRDQLQNMKKASKTVATYLQEIRSIANAFKVTGSPVDNDELAVKILSGLGHEYREITAAIRARETALSFEELFQKLTDHELFLKHQDIDRSSSIITAAVAQRTNFQPQHQKIIIASQINLQDHKLHDRRSLEINRMGDYPAKVNFVSNHHSNANPWIIDSGATHHVTIESDNLEEYTGNEEMSIGDGKTILITHTDFTQIKASNSNFMLSNTLCAPAIKKNLISVAKFCTDNLTSIEFFPHSFLVKDLKTRRLLVQG
ncbi:uncharacterized protein [Solanum tuberosum]|uniref:uncharacterized protein n=1 Tax=Solanum tuberosum TaxID=4113 RepID=UPI00073A3CA2|nr:PREDICTED: uncharacterized protein LOC107061310 [Solanum tuberosum]